VVSQRHAQCNVRVANEAIKPQIKRSHQTNLSSLESVHSSLHR